MTNAAKNLNGGIISAFSLINTCRARKKRSFDDGAASEQAELCKCRRAAFIFNAKAKAKKKLNEARTGESCY